MRRDRVVRCHVIKKVCWAWDGVGARGGARGLCRAGTHPEVTPALAGAEPAVEAGGLVRRHVARALLVVLFQHLRGENKIKREDETNVSGSGDTTQHRSELKSKKLTESTCSIK